MPYTTLKDIEAAAGGRTTLVQLVPLPADETQVDLEMLAVFQSKADAFVDTYLTPRYSTPLTAPGREVIDCAAELTIYFLRTRPGSNLTQHDIDAYRARVDWLKEIRDGSLRPGGLLPPKSSSVRAAWIENTGPVSRRRM